MRLGVSSAMWVLSCEASVWTATEYGVCVGIQESLYFLSSVMYWTWTSRLVPCSLENNIYWTPTMWKKTTFWILQAPYYRMDAVVTVEETETLGVWFAQGHTGRLEPALEPLSLSDSYVTEMRTLPHSPESESSSTTTTNCVGHHHCFLASLQRKGWFWLLDFHLCWAQRM